MDKCQNSLKFDESLIKYETSHKDLISSTFSDNDWRSECHLSEVAHRAIGLKTEFTHAKAVTLWAGDNFHSQARSYNPEKAKLFNKKIIINIIIIMISLNISKNWN